MTLEQQIFEARVSNWANVIGDKITRLVKEGINDVDLSIRLLNGDIAIAAQEEFAAEYKQNMYDKQCILRYEYD